MLVHYLSLLGIDTTTVTDSGSARVVLIVTVFLVVLGLALAVLTVQLWKFTRPDPGALGPLMEMSSRKFAELDAIEQRHRLDVMRPSALSVAPSVAPGVLLPPLDPVETVAPLAIEGIDALDEVSVGSPDEVIFEEIAVDEVLVTRKVGPGPDSISWDDDEWPDVDDWSIPTRVVQSRTDSESDIVDPAPINPIASEPRSRESIDPLLGF